MKLLFIYTGGTIQSTKEDSVIHLDPVKKSGILKAFCRRFPDLELPEIEEEQPFLILSENHTGETLYALTYHVHKALEKMEYDGVIVFHGTDTLAYGAAAVSYTEGSDCWPVIFVSSNKPIEDPESNGLANLYGALAFLKQRKARGVYVSYQNRGENTQIHRASRLQRFLPFSDELRSVYDSFLGWIAPDGRYVENPSGKLLHREQDDEISAFAAENFRKDSQVLYLPPCPGMLYPEISRLQEKGIKAVLLGCFHSGTLNTQSEESCRFYQEANEAGISLYASGVMEGAAYESTKAYEKFGIQPLRQIAPIAAYVKLWLGISAGLSPEKFLEKPLAGDILWKI